MRPVSEPDGTQRPVDAQRVERTRVEATHELLARRGPDGHWEGRLSSSALSTATACIALQQCGALAADAGRVSGGAAWLVEHQNADGGWGDTTDSPSNVSTTLLAWVALGLLPDPVAPELESVARCEAWLGERIGELSPENLSRAVGAIYGEDRTFAVPIQVTCALGGRLGDGPAAWRAIPRLPFELACLPHATFHRLGLPMVSYAMPALIAIGIAIAHHKRNWNPITRGARAALRGRALGILERIQPSSGGFLEATPLTSFVCLSLGGSGLADHPVVHRGLDFLRASVRADGSWPIDTNLATWVTSLAVDALGPDALRPSDRHAAPNGTEAEGNVTIGQVDALASWLSGQQYLTRHPYTHAEPGGWAWTDLPGGVPDADDTPAALLALASLGALGSERAGLGVRWLSGLQNRDGGIPTFCRGWGKLPFDRSCPDLTAHALRAFEACGPLLDAESAAAVDVAGRRATRYLIETQRPDGAWVPLWFGNQGEARMENPLYGTSRVVKALGAGQGVDWDGAISRGLAWMLRAQGEDGGFGGGPGLSGTVEETGLALDGMASAALVGAGRLDGELLGALRQALARGADWLARRTEGGTRFEASPIGLYFAKLWYSEELYPLIFTVAGLRRAHDVLGED